MNSEDMLRLVLMLESLGQTLEGIRHELSEINRKLDNNIDPKSGEIRVQCHGSR